MSIFAGESAATAVAIVSTIGTGILAQLPIDPGSLDSLARWPAAALLAGVAIYAIYTLRGQDREQSVAYRESLEKIMSRQEERSREEWETIRALTRAIGDKPCLMLRRVGDEFVLREAAQKVPK